jgi:hypothetical protein
MASEAASYPKLDSEEEFKAQTFAEKVANLPISKNFPFLLTCLKHNFAY